MKPEEIAKMAQIASALEVSGYPKPGNVHRTREESSANAGSRGSIPGPGGFHIPGGS